MKKTILPLILLISLCVNGQKPSWEYLFDGKSLNGWNQMTGSAKYEVENGAIVGTAVPNSPNSFLVCEKKFTGDFILEMQVMMGDTITNSGIQFKSNFDATANKGAGRIYGYQYELDPSARRWSAGVYDEGRREWLYPGSLNSKAQVYFTPNVYHTIKIECIDNTIKTWLDGSAVSYVVDT